MALLIAASLFNLGVGAFVVVRLLSAAFGRSGRAPELFLGVYQSLIVLSGLLGIAFRAAGQESPFLFAIAVATNLSIAVAAATLAFGVWRIYRPADRWPLLLCVGLAIWCLGGWVWTIQGDALPVLTTPTAANIFFITGRIAVYAWAAVESLRYYGLMRKRLRLGLAEPMVTHQILLWGLFALIMGSTAGFFIVVGLTIGDAAVDWLAGQWAVSALLFSSAFCLWFSFFPPAFYRNWIIRRAGATAAG